MKKLQNFRVWEENRKLTEMGNAGWMGLGSLLTQGANWLFNKGIDWYKNRTFRDAGIDPEIGNSFMNITTEMDKLKGIAQQNPEAMKTFTAAENVLGILLGILAGTAQQAQQGNIPTAEAIPPGDPRYNQPAQMAIPVGK